MNPWPPLASLYTVLEDGYGPDGQSLPVVCDGDSIAYLQVMSQRAANELAASIATATGRPARVVPAIDHAATFAGIEHHTAAGPRRIRRYPPMRYGDRA